MSTSCMEGIRRSEVVESESPQIWDKARAMDDRFVRGLE